MTSTDHTSKRPRRDDEKEDIAHKSITFDSVVCTVPLGILKVPFLFNNPKLKKSRQIISNSNRHCPLGNKIQSKD